MNFDNNHFIDAGSGISGILYGTKRAYNSLYDSGENHSPSTYDLQVKQRYADHCKDGIKATQRSNGFVEGSGKPVASGILFSKSETWDAFELVWDEARQVWINLLYRDDPDICPY